MPILVESYSFRETSVRSDDGSSIVLLLIPNTWIRFMEVFVTNASSSDRVQ
jgi:hypothetical protein